MACCCISIRIDESAQFGVIVTGLEVVQAGAGVHDIATVAQGVDVQQLGAGGGVVDVVALAVAIVLENHMPGAVFTVNTCHITLNIGGVVIGIAAVGDGQRRAGGIVGEVCHGGDRRAAGLVHDGQLTELTAVIDIVVLRAVTDPAGAHTVSIVGIRPIHTVSGQARQLSAVLPCIGAVAVGDGIADGIAGDRIGDSVLRVAGQQVAPLPVMVLVNDRAGSGRPGTAGIASGCVPLLPLGRLRRCSPGSGCGQRPCGMGILIRALDIARVIVLSCGGDDRERSNRSPFVTG